MRYASVCSGVEAASLAWMPLGWEAVWFSEIEPFPCAVLKERFPDVPNLGDMTKIKGEKYHGTVDLLVGGTPCFVAGTMVLTPCGYKAIESLKIGDSVVTHTGDVRSITAIGSKEAQTGKVKILGRPSIRCTGNHPFYSIELKRDNKRNSSTYGQKVEYGEYEFKAVEDSVGRYAGRVTAKRIEGHIPNVYNATPEEIVELAGWYIGDGYIRRWNGKNKKAVIIAAVCKRKIDQFSKTFNGAIRYSVAKDGKITITNTVLANWLIANFGEKSHSKKLPYWIYTSELRDRLIAGYEKTDGSRCANGNVRISTTSAALAYGMADLYGNASVEFCKRETPHVIMGRKVSQRDTYTIYKAKGKTARTKMLCGRYASIIRGWNNDGAIRTVYNITVDGEHSYIVNGIAVHNCQGFSVEGKQGGLNDPRSALCLAYCNLLETMRPHWFVWENVPGVFSTNGGEDFKTLLRTFDEIGYSVAWRVLDAQYVRVDGFPRAVPQRRRRVFVVGHLGGDWRYPASVLFEPGCLPGDTPPRRIKGEGVARSLTASTGGASGKEQQHTFIRGDGIPLNSVDVLATGQANAETAADCCVNLTCNHEAPIICAGFSGGQGEKARGIGYREEVSPTIRSAESGSNQVPDILCQYGDVAGALTARHDSSPCADRGMNIVYENHAQDSRVKPVEVFHSIVALMGTGGNNLPLLQEVPRDPETAIGFIKNYAGGDLQGFWDEVFPTMRTEVTPAVAREECFHVSFCDANGRRKDRPNGGLYVTEAKAGKTVTAGGPGAETVIVEPIALDGDKMKPGERSGGSGMGVSEEGVMYTQTAGDVHGVAYTPSGKPTVRKLLPLECERLMGFPDNHTRIPWRGKPVDQCPDGPRYKACGNSMCVNVMRWIGMRIENVERRMK